jgi:hypothetical protein
MADRDVQVHGVHFSGGVDLMGVAVWGCVGSDISNVDLISEDRLISRAVESPIGAIVVAFDATTLTMIHLSASDGTLVKALSYDPDRITLD